MSSADHEVVIDFEMRLLRPEVRADRDALESLLDDDFNEIGAGGRRWTRAEIIDELVASPAVEELVIGDVRARTVTTGVVVVTYVTTSPTRRVVRAGWWRWSEAGWRCCFHQGTLVVETTD